MTLLANFSALDELIQVLYEGASRFVLVSHLQVTGIDSSDADSDADSGAEWVIHLGLVGNENGTGNGKGARWWMGRWTEGDVMGVVDVGEDKDENAIEGVCERLVKAIVEGEVGVGVWSGQKGAEIILTFDTKSNNPLTMRLKEMSAEEAATFAAGQLFAIGLQAQNRGCKIDVSPFDLKVGGGGLGLGLGLGESSKGGRTSGKVASPVSSRSKKRSRSPPPPPPPAPPPQKSNSFTTTTNGKEDAAQKEIKALREQLWKAKEEAKKATHGEADVREPVVPPKPPKGASIANPNKKARRFKAMEFEDD